MIYVILYSMGDVNDLFHTATSSKREAEKMYEELMVTRYFPEKALWSIDSGGVRTLMLKQIYEGDVECKPT